jgi:hypothetical protein
MIFKCLTVPANRATRKEETAQRVSQHAQHTSTTRTICRCSAVAVVMLSMQLNDTTPNENNQLESSLSRPKKRMSSRRRCLLTSIPFKKYKNIKYRVEKRASATGKCLSSQHIQQQLSLSLLFQLSKGHVRLML